MDVILIITTILSVTLAAVMSGVAWHLMREERRRSEARVAALAVEIHGAGPPPAITNDVPFGEAPVAVATSSDLFAAAQPGASSGSRLAAVIALGVFVVGSGAALAVVLSSGSRGAANAVPVGSGSSRTPRTEAAGSGSPVRRSFSEGGSRTLRTDTTSRTPPTEAGGSGLSRTLRTDASRTDAPLELVALGHERNANRLTVRGVVRNPPSGRDAGRLTAVVFLFNRDGGFLAGGRAAIDASTLAPGAQSPFAVTVPGAGDVDHYRVSFRMDEGVVPHVDRRDLK